jgi:hypothetical protein
VTNRLGNATAKQSTNLLLGHSTVAQRYQLDCTASSLAGALSNLRKVTCLSGKILVKEIKVPLCGNQLCQERHIPLSSKMFYASCPLHKKLQECKQYNTMTMAMSKLTNSLNLRNTCLNLI